MPNNAAAEKPGSTEHGDDAMVHGSHGLDFVSSCRPSRPGGSGHVAARLLTTIYHLGYFVQIGIDLVRQLIEMTPLLAEFRRLMSRSQEIAILPLDLVDDAPPVEAAMQAD
jgi:hypothetical protein